MLYIIFIINVTAFAVAMNDLTNEKFNSMLWFCVVSNLLMLGKIALMEKQLKENKANSTQAKIKNTPNDKNRE